MPQHQSHTQRWILCILATLFAYCLPGFCQTGIAAELESVQPDKERTGSDLAAQKTRPKIGLVLSGGGARGFAHIGVLKVLEENNIPIDYVVGTSMGSIIGGLYAIGETPEDIEKGVEGIAWDKVFKDFANRDYKSFRRKQDDYDFFNLHRVGITDDGLQISPGLIEGQQIELALDRLAYPGFHIKDFDRFRIPYRAIATDIATGEPFVIKQGNIARAMRASMSIPGALPPIKIDGHLLVDGGIANNIPVDVVRSMGADIVIVVDVSAPLLTADEVKSGIDVTAQLTNILTRRVADKQLQSLGENDVLIVPGEPDITASDFEQYATLIQAGEAAASENLEAIKKLSLSYEAFSEHVSSLPDVARNNPVIDFIEIKNHTALRDEVIRVRIHQQLGEALDVPQLEQDLSYIYGLDYSGSVVYSLEQVDGRTGLFIYVRDRQWARSYLQFGLSIESALEIQSITNLHVSYNKSDLNDLAGEFRAVAALGSEPELSGEYYQPIDVDLDLFVSAKTGFETLVVPTLIGDRIESIQRFNRTYIRLAAGKIFNQTSQLSLGLRYNDGKVDSISGPSFVADSDFIESYYYVSLLHDSLDNLSFPNTGFFSRIDYTANRESLGADADYEQLKIEIAGAGTFRRYTVFSRAIAESTLDEVTTAAQLHPNALLWHGGFLELSGTIRNELLGQHFGMLETAFYRRLGDITFLPIYTGFSLEAGNSWLTTSDITSDSVRYAGSLFIGADSFLGPIYVAIGATDKGDAAFYLNIGKSFLESN